MSLDRGRRGQGPGRGARECDPSSEIQRNRGKFCPAPESGGARSFEGVGAMSGGRFGDYPAGAGNSGQPGVSHKKNEHSTIMSECPIMATTAVLSQQHTKDTRQVIQKAKLRHSSDRVLIHRFIIFKPRPRLYTQMISTFVITLRKAHIFIYSFLHSVWKNAFDQRVSE